VGLQKAKLDTATITYLIIKVGNEIGNRFFNYGAYFNDGYKLYVFFTEHGKD
jgi:hypothetical protein